MHSGSGGQRRVWIEPDPGLTGPKDVTGRVAGEGVTGHARGQGQTTLDTRMVTNTLPFPLT